jgi:hypothetical protein
LAGAEKEHVEELIVAVVKRTNKFRVASYLTILNVIIFGCCCLLVLLVISILGW